MVVYAFNPSVSRVQGLNSEFWTSQPYIVKPWFLFFGFFGFASSYYYLNGNTKRGT